MPSITSAHQKLAIATPASAIAAHAARHATPASITCSTPKRLMREPVKNDGANMPITWEASTNAAASYGWPQKLMARGVAVMSRFITAYPMAPTMTATMNEGWRAISASGRGAAACALAAGSGMRRMLATAMAAAVNRMSEANVARYS